MNKIKKYFFLFWDFRLFREMLFGCDVIYILGTKINRYDVNIKFFKFNTTF